MSKNIVKIAGKEYTEHEREAGSCDGCSLFNEPVSVCHNTPCSALFRDDGRNVKFVEVKGASK